MNKSPESDGWSLTEQKTYVEFHRGEKMSSTGGLFLFLKFCGANIDHFIVKFTFSSIFLPFAVSHSLPAFLSQQWAGASSTRRGKWWIRAQSSWLHVTVRSGFGCMRRRWGHQDSWVGNVAGRWGVLGFTDCFKPWAGVDTMLCHFDSTDLHTKEAAGI